jgi:hypothetical protein
MSAACPGTPKDGGASTTSTALLVTGLAVVVMLASMSDTAPTPPQPVEPPSGSGQLVDPERAKIQDQLDYVTRDRELLLGLRYALQDVVGHKSQHGEDATVDQEWYDYYYAVDQGVGRDEAALREQLDTYDRAHR